MFKPLVRNVFAKMGYMVVKKDCKIPGFPDMEEEFTKLLAICRPNSMATVERMYSLYKAVEYVIDNNIPGDFVECGVWRGGSSMMMALTLLSRKIKDRKIFLYDTFAGMSEPNAKDLSSEGKSALDEWNERKGKNLDWFAVSVETVQQNLWSTGYPKDKLVFTKGKVEDTIPGVIPEKIALLRLDTDWYDSTYHELKHMFPRLSKHGVLLIDDYGYWKGSKDAVDQYFRENNISMLLNRIDGDARIGVKLN